MYHQFMINQNETVHAYGTCVSYSIESISWTNAKFFCQTVHKQGHLVTEYSIDKHIFNQNLFSSLSFQAEPFKYHIGLHFVSNGNFWEQSDLPITPLTTPLFPIDSKPSSTQQCISNLENMDTTAVTWQNENCFNDLKPLMCEVPA